MSRGSLFTASFLVVFGLWILGLLYLDLKQFKTIFVGLPSYFLISFGCYALFEIGKGLAGLKDHEKEYINTLGDIKRANDFMNSKGIDINQK